ncbi:hypothetical protein A5747_13550 [Mycobacterium sp. IS-836]|uniref:RNA ligase family protein n=1 Tax=Mycobacterium sp. IS-836 TaxID=1834160 RepID=UPI00096BE8C4|nr:RNA ligase family protein [Mycobacterium sp. IS-836]OMC55411.1 hypothetical protein A5747_13550 [Mycobacterium sp. IS-836]
MKFDQPANVNYAATIVRVPAPVDLPGLDNLVGIPILGHQALTQRGIEAGELRVLFTAETQLSDDYAHQNNLFRHADLNKDEGETGYLEDNRRIKALKLRGHRSNALLMPLESLAYTGLDIDKLRAELADVSHPVVLFDKIGDHEICKKYELPRKAGQPARSKVERAFKRVDKKVFPEHLETDSYFRSRHVLRAGREVVITQKLHGTSWRGGRVPVLRQLKWYEKLLKRLGVNIPEWEYDVVFGSRKVIKDPNNPNQEHFYKFDLWTEYGKRVANLIPEGFIVYGELIGWTPDGAPLQRGYTYHLARNEAELYVYRVAHINRQGHLSDLSWDGVKQFCQERGLKWTPELFRFIHDFDPEYDTTGDTTDDIVDSFMDRSYAELYGEVNPDVLPLSDPKTVDEGVVIRQEGLVPVLLKAKSQVFLEHETKLLDRGELDMESVA